MSNESASKKESMRRVTRLLTMMIPVAIIAAGLSIPALAGLQRSSPVITFRVDSSEHLPHVTLLKGEYLVVTMDSTYWKIQRPSGRALRTFGTSVTHRMFNCAHLPGSGCGTVVESFVAIASGVSVISAARSSCGEALLCSAANARWSVSVRVR
ncbi:MAG TPA: hypothetical protein VNE42_03105 [Acidimicrobiales bacterium]|nr:hypothetical protein [Acidimicrobiales bacterium]